jgi:four helix bundle protein
VYGQINRQEPLRKRTKKFALRIIRRFRHLPRSTEVQVLGRQRLRSGTSAGANYRAARDRTLSLFSKVGLVVAAADETAFWLDCLVESGFVKEELLKHLLGEANDREAIFKASHRTARPW